MMEGRSSGTLVAKDPIRGDTGRRGKRGKEKSYWVVGGGVCKVEMVWVGQRLGHM